LWYCFKQQHQTNINNIHHPRRKNKKHQRSEMTQGIGKRRITAAQEVKEEEESQPWRRRTTNHQENEGDHEENEGDHDLRERERRSRRRMKETTTRRKKHNTKEEEALWWNCTDTHYSRIYINRVKDILALSPKVLGVPTKLLNAQSNTLF